MYNVTFGINLYTSSLIRQHKLSKLHINNRYNKPEELEKKGKKSDLRKGVFKKFKCKKKHS